MARHRGPVLVDTNVILECWRIGAWKALTNGYTVETVEDCVIETQTGYQRRRAEQQIDRAALLASLSAVHKVSDSERAAAAVRNVLFSYLDVGAIAVGAHARPQRCLGAVRPRHGEHAVRRARRLSRSPRAARKFAARCRLSAD